MNKLATGTGTIEHAESLLELEVEADVHAQAP